MSPIPLSFPLSCTFVSVIYPLQATTLSASLISMTLPSAVSLMHYDIIHGCVTGCTTTLARRVLGGLRLMFHFVEVNS
jgi:hypothetical protein